MHATSGQGRAANEGYDALVPLVDSGIYVCVWSTRPFASVILDPSAEFDDALALEATRGFFELTERDTASISGDRLRPGPEAPFWRPTPG